MGVRMRRPFGFQYRFFRPRGLWAWLVVVAASLLGLVVALWLLATVMILAGAALAFASVYALWLRFKLRKRRLPPYR